MKFRQMSLSLMLWSLTTGIACTTTQTAEQKLLENLVFERTQMDRKYQGFYNTYQVQVTSLDSRLQMALVDQMAENQDWSHQKLLKERERVQQEISTQKQVLLTFYSPEQDFDDWLNPHSIWKAYLTHNGVRYEGQVTQPHFKKVELKNLFPHIDRFSSNYLLIFHVPTTATERGSSQLTLTSTLGRSEFFF